MKFSLLVNIVIFSFAEDDDDDDGDDDRDDVSLRFIQ